MEASGFKDFHIGGLVRNKVDENNILFSRICNFFKCSVDDVEKMFNEKSMDTELLLKWSKLLEYDFFRIYSQHLILYSPPSKDKATSDKVLKSRMPQFRKSLYNKEIIDFVVELIVSNKKTQAEIIEEYRIPKSTLIRWLAKYNKK